MSGEGSFLLFLPGSKDERYVLTWQVGNRAQKGRNALLDVDGTCTNSTHEREQSWSSIFEKVSSLNIVLGHF